MNDVSRPMKAGGDPELDMRTRDLAAQLLRKGNLMGAKRVMKAVYAKPTKSELKQEDKERSGADADGY